MGNEHTRQILELQPPNYPLNSMIIKQEMPWRNIACPHGCTAPVIPSWKEGENEYADHQWWHDAGLTQQTMDEEIEKINKKASEFMMNLNWKYKGYIVGYICYALSILISIITALILIFILEDTKILWFLLIAIFIMLAIGFINLAVCEWHKYLWNLCLKQIENDIVKELNARYTEYKVSWSAHSRMVQHGSARRTGKGGNYAYKRKYVDIICVGENMVNGVAEQKVVTMQVTIQMTDQIKMGLR